MKELLLKKVIIFLIINMYSVHDYVRELTDHPDLLDLLSFTDEPAKDEGPVVGKMAKRTQLYEEVFHI